MHVCWQSVVSVVSEAVVCQWTTGVKSVRMNAVGYWDRMLSELNPVTGLARWHDESVWFARGIGSFFWACGATVACAPYRAV